MKCEMLGRILKDYKVVIPIVAAVAIDVMDNSAFRKRSSQSPRRSSHIVSNSSHIYLSR